MSLPDFTPRLMELQAQVNQLAYEKELLMQALLELMEAYECRMGDWENADFNPAYRQAQGSLEVVRRRQDPIE